MEDDGSVRVTIPYWGTKKGARAFAESVQPWIAKQRRRLQEQQPQDRADAPNGRLRERPSREAIRDAKRQLTARLFELAAAHALTVARVSVRNQRSLWGSCSRAGHISLNWRLAQLPEAVRDYVLIHELMHLKRLDHSPKFWKLVAQACPDYRELRRQLHAMEKNGSPSCAMNEAERNELERNELERNEPERNEPERNELRVASREPQQLQLAM